MRKRVKNAPTDTKRRYRTHTLVTALPIFILYKTYDSATLCKLLVGRTGSGTGWRGEGGGGQGAEEWL